MKYKYTDKKYNTVSDVVGLSKSDASKKLKDFTVEFQGSGDKVYYQSPSAGERIHEGETVRVFLN